MKIKALIVILSIVLLLSVAGNGFVYALSQAPKNEESQDDIKDVDIVDVDANTDDIDVDIEAQAVSNGETFVRQNIDTHKNIVINEKTIKLDYEKSEKISSTRVFDVYSNSESEYKFNRSGALVSRNDYKSVKKDITTAMSKKDEKINEGEAIKLSCEFVALGMPEIIGDYEVVECNFNDSLAMYFVDFAKVYNGFISSERIAVKITALGKPVSWNCAGYGEYADFDENTVKSVSKEKIEEYAKKQVDVIYGNKLVGHSIDDFYLRKVNGNYVVSFTVSVKWVDVNGVELAAARTMYYEI